MEEQQQSDDDGGIAALMKGDRENKIFAWGQSLREALTPENITTCLSKVEKQDTVVTVWHQPIAWEDQELVPLLQTTIQPMLHDLRGTLPPIYRIVHNFSQLDPDTHQSAPAYRVRIGNYPVQCWCQ
jgi:hypothetical protein